MAIPNYYSSNVTVLLNGLPFTSSESVTPSTGSGISQTFTFKYLGGNGLNDLAVVYALINANLSGAAGCFSYYVPATNSIYLLNDAGTEATGAPITPGGPGTLSNSQCSIDGPESSAIGVSNQLSLTLRVTFKQAVTGTQTLYGLSASSGNVNSGWKLLGTWTPQNIIDTPPTADSVTPSAGSGVIQSFAFKYSSANGFGYLNTVFALMNGSLKATAGCFAYYTRATNSIYLLDFSGTAVTGQPLTPGVAGTASNGKCTIDGAGSSVVGSGNTLTLTLAVTFTPGLRDLQTIYGFAVDGGNRNSGWTTLGTWTSQNVVNTPPTADSVTPNAGSGGTQHFIFKYSSANSYLYLNTLFVLFNRTLSGAGGCFFYYNPATVSVYLLNDQGTALAGPPLPLGSGTVSNGQCSIAGAGSSINQSGNSVALGLVITFKSSFTGMQTIYGYATDNGNHNSGWSNLGTWTTQPVSNTPPTVGSVSPQAGSGASQNFVFKYSSVNGSGYLSSAYALFNSSLTGVAGCLAFYVPGNNAVYLLNDAGSDLAGPGLTPGASGSVSNSQCTINGAGTSAVTSGNTLTLTLAVAFKPSFNGTQTTYGFASDAGGMNSGWQALGSWTSH